VCDCVDWIVYVVICDVLLVYEAVQSQELGQVVGESWSSVDVSVIAGSDTVPSLH
jgi:hypothetical protein